jgi:hypothetical protein
MQSVSYQRKVGNQFFPELHVLHFYSITGSPVVITEAAFDGKPPIITLRLCVTEIRIAKFRFMNSLQKHNYS